jgi:hypothetical protein
MTTQGGDSLIVQSPAAGPWTIADWDSGFSALKRYVALRGSAVVPPGARADGIAVGAWVAARRADYWNGKLDPNRAEALEALPGWDWSGCHQRRWFTVFAALTRFVAKHHMAEIEPRLVFNRVRLGSWVEAQRIAYAAGTLPRRNADLLAAIPGWEWHSHREGAAERSPIPDGPTLLQRAGHADVGAHNRAASTVQHQTSLLLERRPADDDRWDAGYAALCAYAKRTGKARPSRDAMYQGFAVGAWVHETRRRYRRGDLDISRAEALESLPGWLWNVADAVWHQGLDVLLRYQATCGSASPTASVVFDGLRLGVWVRTQRKQYRHGKLAGARKRRLEAVPGWTWTPRRASTGQRELRTRAADRAV